MLGTARRQAMAMAASPGFYYAVGIASSAVTLPPQTLSQYLGDRPEAAANIAFLYFSIVGIILNGRLAFRSPRVSAADSHGKLATGCHVVAILVANSFMAPRWYYVVLQWASFAATLGFGLWSVYKVDRRLRTTE